MSSVFHINLILHYFFASSTYILIDLIFDQPDWLLEFWPNSASTDFSTATFLMFVFLSSAISFLPFIDNRFNPKSWCHDENKDLTNQTDYWIQNIAPIVLVSFPFFWFFYCTTVLVKNHGGSFAGVALVLLPVFIFLFATLADRLWRIGLQLPSIGSIRIAVFSIIALVGVFIYKNFELGIVSVATVTLVALAFSGRAVFNAYLLVVSKANENRKEKGVRNYFFPDLNQCVLVFFMSMPLWSLSIILLGFEDFYINTFQLTMAILIGIFAVGIAEVFKNKAAQIDAIPTDIIEAFSFLKGAIAAIATWLLAQLFPSRVSADQNHQWFDVEVFITSTIGLFILMVAGDFWVRWRRANQS